MTDFSTILLVIGRELRAWRKPFLISSAIVLSLVAIGMTALTLTSGRDDTVTYRLGLVEDPPAAVERDVRSLLLPDGRLEVERYESVSEAERAAGEREVDAVVVGTREVLWGPGVRETLADAVWMAVSAERTRQSAEAAGLTARQAEDLAYPAISSRVIPAPEAGTAADEVLAAIAVILMFMSILAYGQWIGYAVVEEKASRVVEVLLGAIRPHQLMTAKVVSIGMLGLVQIAAVGGLGLGIGLATDRIELPAASGAVVAWILVWFLLGYAFYGSLYAAGGSLASNTQEAGSVIGPMSILVGIGYVMGLITVQGGVDTTLIRVASQIPLWAPMLMPARIARGWAEGWEIALSVGLMLIAGYATIRLAGRIYLGGVARATSKLGWREAFRGGIDLGSRSSDRI